MKRILVCFLAIAVWSCSKDENNESIVQIEDSNYLFNEENKTEYDVLLSEYSQLIGSTLQSEKAKQFLEANMVALSDYGDKISISYLLGNVSGVRVNESSKLLTSKGFQDNSFISAIKENIVNNQKKYKYLLSKANLPSKTLSSKTNGNKALNQILEGLAKENLEIYMPSKELDNEVDTSVLYVSYEPTYYTKTNEAFKYTNTGLFAKSTSEKVERLEVDDDFIEENNVIIIKPIGKCDLIITANECESKGDPDPLPENNGPKLLKYNVNHTSIKEKDILSTILGWFRVNGKQWAGFAASHVKLALWRGSIDGSVTVSGNQVIPGAKAYSFASLRITRRTARKGNWRKVNIEFDDDWQMSENEQALGVFTKHNISSKASTDLEAKSGFKIENGKVKPTHEATGSAKVKAEEKAAKFREKRGLSRRQVLATIIGNGVTGLTLYDPADNVHYNVKQAGRFEYVLKHYYTKID